MKQHLIEDRGNLGVSSAQHDRSAAQEQAALESDRTELLHHATLLCAETKAKDIVAIDVRGYSDLSDCILVVSGRSDRQVQGISNRLIEGLSEHGLDLVAVEGIEKGHWVVLDFGALIVHVFYEPVRAHFDLESLWAQAPRIPAERLGVKAA